MITYVI